MSRYNNTKQVLGRKCSLDVTKTIAEAFVDGSISDIDLQVLNPDNPYFKSNNHGQIPGEAERYSSQDAMVDFFDTLDPYLSDQTLFNLAKRLCTIETGKDTQAFRNSTLAKTILMHIIKREARKSANGTLTELPASILYIIQTQIMTLIDKNWTGDNRVEKFINFNLLQNEIIKSVVDSSLNGSSVVAQLADFDSGVEPTCSTTTEAQLGQLQLTALTETSSDIRKTADGVRATDVFVTHNAVAVGMFKSGQSHHVTQLNIQKRMLEAQRDQLIKEQQKVDVALDALSANHSQIAGAAGAGFQEYRARLLAQRAEIIERKSEVTNKIFKLDNEIAGAEDAYTGIAGKVEEAKVSRSPSPSSGDSED